MRKIFLVDTENVNSKALVGANLLNKEDLIILFVTERTDAHSFSRSKIDMLDCKAKIQRINVLTGERNSLDFQLVSYLGLLIGSDGNKEKNNYYIVSRDKGFYSSINLLTNCSEHNLELIPNLRDIVYDCYIDIKDALRLRNLEDEITVELKSYGYTDRTVDKAIIAIETGENQEEIEINFFYKFGWNTRIFDICKPIIDNFYSNIS